MVRRSTSETWISWFVPNLKDGKAPGGDGIFCQCIIKDHQPNSTTTMEEDINVDKTTLNPVQESTYIDSIIARDGHIEAELQKRMSKGIRSVGRRRERLWNNHNVSIRAKTKIYRVIILSTLLYGAEIWTVYRSHMPSIMKTKCQEKVTNIKVLKRAGLPSMEDRLIRKNLRWTEHLLREDGN